MKKIISLLMSLIVSASAILTPLCAFAGESVQALIEKGFPHEYAEKISVLSEKYPMWSFEPFNTGLDFYSAVNGERSVHSKQLIQKTSLTNESFMCNCSSCFSNGSHIVFEASDWVSASENAVAYFLDSRNFINEEKIWQFETTKYNPSQTRQGVEAILSGTWMHDSSISYYDSASQLQSLDINYSEAILEAAENSDMSAYYLASKIVQEVGGAQPTAYGACGTVSEYDGKYKGIYNYYNIGANTGAVDGLEYASKSNEEYLLPWNNPYKSIVGGAKIISEGFSKYQSTPYLQKFNVNSESGKLYYNEYMANVEGASREATRTYDAYLSVGDISSPKTFLIPVFNNMPQSTENGVCSGVAFNHPAVMTNSYLNVRSIPSTSGALVAKLPQNIQVTILEKADKWYKICFVNNGVQTVAYGASGYFSLVHNYNGGKYCIYCYCQNPDYQEPVAVIPPSPPESTQTVTAPSQSSVKKPKSTSIKKLTKGKKSFKVTWKKVSGVSGYQVQYSTSKKFTKKTTKTKTYNSNKSFTKTISKLKSKKKYYVRVRAYKTVNGKRIYSSWSKVKSITTK